MGRDVGIRNDLVGHKCLVDFWYPHCHRKFAHCGLNPAVDIQYDEFPDKDWTSNSTNSLMVKLRKLEHCDA